MTVSVTATTLRGWPLPEPASEKHGRGVVLVVGGSAGTPGAVRLAAEAALRAGSGKARIATVASVAPSLAVALPEARVYGLPETPAGDLAEEGADRIAEVAGDADATLVGPGLVDPDGARALLGALLPATTGAWVLDALASAYVDEQPRLPDVDRPCVLTLNPAELAHVLGSQVAPEDLAGAAAELASTSRAVVLVGGETKVVGCPDGSTYAVTAGGPGLATAGSGDVQAGLVAGLLARGAEPAQAAVWAAWLHGTAGDRVAGRVGSLGLLAGELAGEVPRLLDQVRG